MSPSEKTKKLEALFAEAEKRRSKKLLNFQKLSEVSSVLESARARRFSFREIHEVLKRGGIEVPLHHLTAYFHEEMKLPIKRRRRKAKPQPKKPAPAASKPGRKFRVASDDL